MTENVKEEPGKLTPEQIKTIAEWIKSKSSQRGGLSCCEVCGANEWKLIPNIFTPIPYDEDGNVAFGIVTPMIFLMCENCANVKAFNALRIGVAKRNEEEKKQ